MCDINLCGIAENLIIGLVSGGVSSYIVNIIWKRKLDKLEDKEKEIQFQADFFDDVQTKCKYLERIQLELGFEESGERNQNILRLIEETPDTQTFKKGMTQEGKDLLLEIISVKDKIKKYADNNTLPLPKSIEYKSQLLKLEIELLSHRTSFRRKWEDVKNEK